MNYTLHVYHSMVMDTYAVLQILPSLVGKKITEFFDIVRPIIEFRFEIVLARSNNIFEIATIEPLDVLTKVVIPIKFVICPEEYRPVGPAGATPRVGWTRQGPVIIT